MDMAEREAISKYNSKGDSAGEVGVEGRLW